MNELIKEAIEMLDNVAYWDGCPDDYIKRIDALKEALAKPEQEEPVISTFPLSHEACDSFWDSWKKNGEPHKHGYYESTWMAIRAYLEKAAVTKDQRATKAIMDKCVLQQETKDEQ